ncbi:hypothetical protein [Photobacterium sp. GB-56]|uniref:hypothetical protein n=1 Tax=Photobacterium sp. GB-56 TaxID=2022106 RepID=UPI000D17FD24|nr:hypothetical protein [Photobacterium sp. GB-56]PSV27932.1 hypothetical protein C9J42_06115 [Photobacterium sp. GB-56]
MKQQTLFSDNIFVSYSQFYIECEDPDDSLLPSNPFHKQQNGLCGAAQSERLFFTAAPTDSLINLEIELLDSKPEVDENFDEIVEVSFTRGAKDILLCEWAHEEEYPLNIPEGIYRVRYNIKGFELDYDYENIEEPEDDEELLPPLDGQKYLIQFWPSDFKSDQILKKTSEYAAYWHNVAKEKSV